MHSNDNEFAFIVSVTPSTTVRAGWNVVEEFHDICCGGGWTNFKSGRTGSGAGIAGASRIVVGGVRPQRDERSKVRAVRGDQILNARLLAPKPARTPEPARALGGWIEAVVEEGSPPRVPAGALRIYFAGGAYCQISSAGETALAAELLGRLGAKR